MTRRRYIVIAFLCVSLNLIAQPGNPGAPIGGLFYLLIAGVTLGLVTLKKKGKSAE